MNNPFLYIQKCKIKNRIFSIFKNPSSLIGIIIVIALFAVTIIGGNSSPYDAVSNMNELYSIVLIIFAFVFISTSYGGISKGASMFTMADVNFLFVSPKKPVSILIYGLIQQMGTSLLLGLFIIFQYTVMHSRYGVGFDFLITSLILYAVCAFCGQLTAMIIYIMTSASDRKRAIAKYTIIALAALFAIYGIYKIYKFGSADYLENASNVGSSFAFSLFPIAGWARLIMMGIYSDAINYSYIILGAVLILLYVIIMVTLVVVKKTDYYEDVLKATETSFNAISARKDGKLAEPIPQNIKVGKTGIGKGFGVSVIYFKHKIERRRSKVLVFDTVTLIYMAISVVFAFLMRGQGILPIFLFMTYLQVFTVAIGRWGKELQLHYIYLFPDKPFIKLMMCLKESIITIVFESIVSFIIVAFIIKLDLFLIVACILLRISYGILLTASNLFVERFFSGLRVKAIILMLYFFLTIIFAFPGITLMVLIKNLMGDSSYSMFLAFSFMSIINFLVSSIVLFASRNLLSYPELSNR